MYITNVFGNLKKVFYETKELADMCKIQNYIFTLKSNDFITVNNTDIY